jgi:hypothetical protein
LKPQHLSSIKEYGGCLACLGSYSSRFLHYQCCEDFSVGVLGNIRSVKNNPHSHHHSVSFLGATSMLAPVSVTGFVQN